MPVELANPWGLLLLLAIPPALWAARRSLAGLEGGRALVSTALRVSILLLLALAAAGPRLRLGSSDLSIVFLLDASASVASDARGEAIELVEQSAREASPRDRVGVVVFGGDASVERALREGGLGTRLDNLASVVRSDRTDIAGALRLAAGLVPDGTVGRLVLLSDGNENEGSAVEEARRLRPRGIQVYSVPLRSGGGPEVAVADLRLPDSPAAGESFDLRVEVTATRDTNARLRVFRNNAPVAERDVALAADGTNVFLLPQRLDAKGFYTYRAEVEAVAADGFAQNNGREAFTYVEGRPRTLYVYGDARPSAALADVLEAGRFDAEIVAARQFPVHLADLQNYDLIIFDNVSAETLAPSQLADIRAYVRDLGGGFVMIGGDKSFGAGGYYKTPVEETLPVSLDVRQKKRFPALALVLVVDKSGSMEGGGGESKMTLAKEGAVSAVDFLADTDAVGVVAFDDASKVVVPLGELAGEKEEVKNLIGTIVAGGGTTIYPALKTAHDALTLYEAPLKHIVLLSDGQSNEGDYAQLVGLLKAQKITLSTVAVGADADLRLMEYLAGATGGRFYISEDVGSLPRIFTKEAFLASRSTIVEEPTPALPAHPAQATAGIDWGSAPPLGGYVGSAPRDLATTALVTHHDDPLYATWQFGLGRSAAFTSGTGRRWAAGWLGWGGFPTFWTQVFRETVRRASNERLQPAVMVEGGRGRVTVDAFTAAGGSANDVSLTGRVVAPDGSASDVVLRQTAPGRYEAEFEAAGEGAYLVSLVSSASQGGARVTGAVRGYSPEFEVRETDRDLLERVAAASGGSVVGEETRLFAERGWASRPRDVWQWCVLAALLLLPVDVGVRRVRLSRYELAEGAAWVRARVGLGARVAPASVEVASLESLKATKRRAVMTAEPAPRAPSEAGMGDDTRASPVPSAPPEAPRPGESPSAPPGAPSPDTRTAEDALSSRLLDARRRRRSSGDE